MGISLPELLRPCALSAYDLGDQRKRVRVQRIDQPFHPGILLGHEIPVRVSSFLEVGEIALQGILRPDHEAAGSYDPEGLRVLLT